MEFLDSLRRGLPGGALVLGQGSGKKATVRLGRWSVDAPSGPDVRWIVDGRQRLGALMEALQPPGAPGVSLDIERWVLVTGGPAEDRQGELPGLSAARRIPLPTLLDPASLFTWLRLHPLPQEAAERLFSLAERLRMYRFPVYLVSMEDPDRLGMIFERSNGERLDAVDRFSLQQGASEEAAFGKIGASLQGLGFGRVDDETILRALRALASRGQEKQELPALLRATEAALRRAIVFLQVNGGVPHEALLPYALPLAVLAKFFHEFPRPQGHSRELLRQWLWRGSLGLMLGSHGERHGDAIQAGDEEGSARRLLALVPEVMAAEVTRQDRFHAAHARSRLQLCALASLRPRHAEGALLDLAALLSEPDAPISTLVDAAPSPLAGGVANRALHPRGGALARQLASAAPEVLASHGVPEEARQALVEGDTEAFLEHRSRALAALFERYFSRQSGPP